MGPEHPGTRAAKRPAPPPPYQPPDAATSFRSVLRIVRLQLFAGVVFTAILWAWQGFVPAYSGLAGVLIVVLPNAVFALRIFATLLLRPETAARQVMQGVYLAEIAKLGLTFVLFALAFILIEPLAPGWLFAGFILTQASVAWAALRVARTEAE